MSKFVLEVNWSPVARSDLPNLVGPFDTRDEAAQFAQLDVVNGAWSIKALTYPYHRA